MIGADAQCHATLHAELHQREKTLPDPFQFSRVFGIAVITNVELLGICEIAGVDADFFDPLCRLHGGLGFEMYVGNQGHGAVPTVEFRADVFQIGSILNGGGGDANHLASGFHKTKRLPNAGIRVHCVAGDHRLESDRVGTPESKAPDDHLAAGTSTPGGKIRHMTTGAHGS